MVREIIRDRIKISGISQSSLAQKIGSNQSQLSLFLKQESNSSLDTESLEKCFKELDINLECYNVRSNLAQEVAKILNNKYQVTEVMSMNKYEMAEITSHKEITYLIDVDSNQLNEILSSNIIDYQSTFVHFKALVCFLMQTDSTYSPKNITSSWNKLFGIASIGVLGFMAGPLIGTIGSTILTLGALAYNNIDTKIVMEPIKEFTKKILEIKK